MRTPIAILCTALALHGSLAEAAPTSEPAHANDRANDAAVDRGIYAQHAETLGANKTSFNSYELFLAGLSYGISDTTQISVTTLLPIVSDMPRVLIGNLKHVLWRGPQTIVSVNGMLTAMSFDGDGLFMFGAGGMVDHHVSDRLALFGNLQVSGLAGRFNNSSLDVANGSVLSGSAGATWRAVEFVKLMAEYTVPAVYGRGNTGVYQLDFAPLTGFMYGVRFHGPRIAADLAFIKVLGSGSKDPFAMGFPLVTFNARF